MLLMAEEAPLSIETRGTHWGAGLKLIMLGVGHHFTLIALRIGL